MKKDGATPFDFLDHWTRAPRWEELYALQSEGSLSSQFSPHSDHAEQRRKNRTLCGCLSLTLGIHTPFGLPRREDSAFSDLVDAFEVCLGVAAPHNVGPPMPSIPELGILQLLSAVVITQRQSSAIPSAFKVANGA